MKRSRVSFPRVVLCDECWAARRRFPVVASAQLSIRQIGEVFGPGDVDGRIARWGFVDRSGNVSCSIIARATGNDRTQRVDFLAPARMGRMFFEWATERISATTQGDIPPAFLLAAH